MRVAYPLACVSCVALACGSESSSNREGSGAVSPQGSGGATGSGGQHASGGAAASPDGTGGGATGSGGQSASGGTTAPPVCSAGLAPCDSVCVDISSDTSHCGACNVACMADQSCCSGACVYLQSDGAHCGSCGVACPPGQLCAAAVCGDACPTGQTACSNSCVDILSNAAHCGACNTACAAGQTCQNGACADVPIGTGGVAGVGGAATGGVVGAGGTAAGGVVGAGGATAGSGGATAGNGGQASDEPTLIVSGVDNYWQVGEVTEGGGDPTVTVNESDTHQIWHGLGGTFNEKGWWALQALSANERDRAIRLLFDVQDGIGFTWGRIPMGASDYAMDRYTLNESSGDLTMASFSIERDRTYLLPYIKAAQTVKSDIRFWASPWTPPTWMKSPSPAGGSGFDGGVMRSDPDILRAHALYFARFVQAYEGEGVPIDHVQPQNEPGYTQHYPTCGWGKYRDLDEQSVGGETHLGDFVADYLAPTLQSEGLSTAIWFGTLSNDVFAAEYWDDARSKAGQQITGVGLQWNNVGLVQSIASANYLVMQSEHQCGNYPWKAERATSPADAHRENFLPGMAPNNHAYGEESWDLITDWIEAGVHIYSAWNMVLDTEGVNLDETRSWPQNALLAVDMQAGTLQVTPAYYVFRHVGQYVEPNAVRLGTQGGDALAFRNRDGSIVTILHNSGGSDSQTTLSVAGTTLQFAVPARGWATVNWQP